MEKRDNAACERIMRFISSFDEYFKTVIMRQAVYCKFKENFQRLKLLYALPNSMERQDKFT
jgi:hypothetical protein